MYMNVSDVVVWFIFFFQAEDGIRDSSVTGVQTCALPIFETNDNDFHLVMTDDTLNFSPGGQGTTPSGHSFVAEIPDPNCIGGPQAGSAHSPFIDGIKNARPELNPHFQTPNPSATFNHPAPIPLPPPP